MTRALTDRCDNCKFSLKLSVAWSECHRSPPIKHDTWPEVRSDGWCGEFKEREPKA